MQKWKFCQYLLIFMLFQTFMTLFILFDTKDKNRIFELFLSIQWKSMRAHWCSMFFGENYPFKHLHMNRYFSEKFTFSNVTFFFLVQKFPELSTSAVSNGPIQFIHLHMRKLRTKLILLKRCSENHSSKFTVIDLWVLTHTYTWQTIILSPHLLWKYLPHGSLNTHTNIF